uniref:Uncharacterized protein n=1 Tax=Micrurus carvalhoi TaxID=3147026 RepID=A0A2H6N8M6_9SAUR
MEEVCKEPKMDLQMFKEACKEIREAKEMLKSLEKEIMAMAIEQRNSNEEEEGSLKRDQEQETLLKNIKEIKIKTLMINLINRRRMVPRIIQKKKEIYKKKFLKGEQEKRREKTGEELEGEVEVQKNLVKGKLVKIMINNKIRNFRDKG